MVLDPPSLFFLLPPTKAGQAAATCRFLYLQALQALKPSSPPGDGQVFIAVLLNRNEIIRLSLDGLSRYRLSALSYQLFPSEPLRAL
jgi:hypothetical protein